MKNNPTYYPFYLPKIEKNLIEKWLIKEEQKFNARKKIINRKRNPTERLLRNKGEIVKVGNEEKYNIVGLPKKLSEILQKTGGIPSGPNLKNKLNTFLREAQKYRKSNKKALNKYLIGIRALQKINETKGEKFYKWIANNNKKTIEQKLLGARQFQTKDLAKLANAIAKNGGLKNKNMTFVNDKEILQKLVNEISKGKDVFLSPIDGPTTNANKNTLAIAENLSLEENLKYLKFGYSKENGQLKYDLNKKVLPGGKKLNEYINYKKGSN